MCPIFPSQLPLPLVTLRLSTPSILDTVLLDAQDATPVFSVETLENRTTVYMYNTRKDMNDAWTRGQVAEVAAINWPVLPYGAQKTKQSPIVTVLGESQTSSHFFKKSVFGGSRRFHIPGQQNPMRWKHVNQHYECTLCSHACTSHRAVATFEPAHTTSAARLAIYTGSVSNTLPTSEYHGVDVDMMVYLIITAILLSTQNPAPSPAPAPAPASPKMACHPSPISSMGNYKIDLLAPDEAFVPSQPSPLRSKSSPSSSSSCYSSLPASPISPATELSPINNETFASASSSGCTVSRSPSMLAGRRQSTRHSSPRSGPTSITPYHLPPAPNHPPTLRLQVPSPMHSQSPSPRTTTSGNALLLDTSMPTFYSTEHHHIQYSDQLHMSPATTSSFTIPAPPTEEFPPAYSEIEWTVRVKQPRQVALHTGLAY